LTSIVKEFYRFYGYWAQFWTLVVLNCADFFITRAAYINQGSDADIEFNPFLKREIELHGINRLLVLKLIVLVALFLLLFGRAEGASAASKSRRQRIAKYLMFANFWYLLVVVWGLTLLVFGL